MAQHRHIHCALCVPAKDWHVPADWTADYAMAWFYGEHLATHLADVLSGFAQLLKISVPRCRRCRGARALGDAGHRPCFDVDCACACSHRTTTTEETARADG
jgi:hypothetical protein